MIRRCNAAGVRIYVDLIINHMTQTHEKNVGTGGSQADPGNLSYPDVPFNRTHFNTPCKIHSYRNVVEVRNCELDGLHDLNQAQTHVRDKIVDLMNRLVDMGVAGFRVDAAKHVWPEDLIAIYSRVKTLNPEHGFKAGTPAWIAQEILYFNGDLILPSEYISMVSRTRKFYDSGSFLPGIA